MTVHSGPIARPTFTDTYGDEHTISVRYSPQTGERFVYYDDDGYTLEQVRMLGDTLLAAADAIESMLLPIPGGAA